MQAEPAATLAEAPRCIVYNLEQFDPGSGRRRLAQGPRYFSLMRYLPTWDYTRRNLPILAAAGVTDARLVPPGDAGSLRIALRSLLDDPEHRARLVAEGAQQPTGLDIRLVPDGHHPRHALFQRHTLLEGVDLVTEEG